MLGERGAASAATPARPARRRPRGPPARRTGPRWRRRGSCRPGPPKLVTSSTRRWNSPSTRRLDLLGVHPLGLAGEADEVGEQHGDDAPLLAPGHPQAVATARTEASALRERRRGTTDRRSSGVRAYGNRPRQDGGRRHPATRRVARTAARPPASRRMWHDATSLPPDLAPVTHPRTAAAGAVDAVKIYGARRQRGPRPRRRDRRLRQRRASPPSWARPARASRTLMHCLAGLDSLTSGAVYIGETYLATLNDKAAHRAPPGPGRASSSRPTT